MPTDATIMILTPEQKITELSKSNEELATSLAEWRAYADSLQAELNTLKAANEALAKNAEEDVAVLKAKLKAAKSAPTGDCAIFRGVTYPILGDFRADNTFIEVKRGHCDEGVTLLAIPRQH